MLRCRICTPTHREATCASHVRSIPVQVISGSAVVWAALRSYLRWRRGARLWEQFAWSLSTLINLTMCVVLPFPNRHSFLRIFCVSDLPTPGVSHQSGRHLSHPPSNPMCPRYWRIFHGCTLSVPKTEGIAWVFERPTASQNTSCMTNTQQSNHHHVLTWVDPPHLFTEV